MGHIDHLRTQYQSNITFTHSFNNTITLREKVIFSILRNKYINTEVPFTKGWFVTKLVKIAPVILEKKCFLISLKYFHYFVMIFPWKRAWPIIWTNLIPLYPRVLSAKFSWNGPVVLEKKVKMWKDSNDEDGQRTNLNLKTHLSLQLRWAKNGDLIVENTLEKQLPIWLL